MHTSSDRILTTHTGSLPRPFSLLQLYGRRIRGENVDDAEITRAGYAAMKHVVKQQLECGLDIINNGDSPFGYEQMVRWSSDGRLWNWNWVPGSSNYGYRTTQTGGFTFTQPATTVRLEVYPHATDNCSEIGRAHV